MTCSQTNNSSSAYKTFFHNFVDSGLAHGIKFHKQHSNNGIVAMVTYKKTTSTSSSSSSSSLDYYATVIAKCLPEKDLSLDNLVFEYLAGMFVNTMVPKFPCFMETYGLFFASEADISTLRAEKINKSTDSSSFEKRRNVLFKIFQSPENAHFGHGSSDLKDRMCDLDISHRFLITSQYIPEAISMKDWLKSRNILGESGSMMREELKALFQLLMPLHTLRQIFSHKDLHLDNVLMHKPFDDEEKKYLEFHYHLYSNKHMPTDHPPPSMQSDVPHDLHKKYYMDQASARNKVVFKSHYVTKLIDYGRCFFHNSDGEYIETSSMRLHKYLYKEGLQSCAKNMHFFPLDKCQRYIDMYYLVRALWTVLKLPNGKYRMTEQQTKLMSQIFSPYWEMAIQQNGYCNYRNDTNEAYIHPFIVDGEIFPNMNEAEYDSLASTVFKQLCDYFMFTDNAGQEEDNRRYDGWTKAGEIHIFSNGKSMQFVASGQQRPRDAEDTYRRRPGYQYTMGGGGARKRLRKPLRGRKQQSSQRRTSPRVQQQQLSPEEELTKMIMQINGAVVR